MPDIQLGAILSDKWFEMGLVPDFTIHVCPLPCHLDKDDTTRRTRNVANERLATTSLIIGRRIVASINGNPEFDAATMLRPYTYAYVSTPLLSLGMLTMVVVYECHYRYPLNG